MQAQPPEDREDLELQLVTLESELEEAIDDQREPEYLDSLRHQIANKQTAINLIRR